MDPQLTDVSQKSERGSRRGWISIPCLTSCTNLLSHLKVSRFNYLFDFLLKKMPQFNGSNRELSSPVAWTGYTLLDIHSGLGFTSWFYNLTWNHCLILDFVILLFQVLLTQFFHLSLRKPSMHLFTSWLLIFLFWGSHLYVNFVLYPSPGTLSLSLSYSSLFFGGIFW